MTEFEERALQIMKAQTFIGLGNLILEILKYINP